ncbi:hypothetical protein ACN28C_00810 [Plantactinospora sp. WMMC1484]|uniref:hypothetical protein n=1 Tax=Plantactinospora sp. WMMC1484 TaxID=3404122 RepID=UPI003BF46866
MSDHRRPPRIAASRHHAPVTGDIDSDEPVVDGAAVRLVCETIPPADATTDKVLKMHYHATAGFSAPRRSGRKGCSPGADPDTSHRVVP